MSPGRRRRLGDAERVELQAVYRAHVDAVYAFFAYAGPRGGAEDLTAATFERVVGAWATYDPRLSAPRTWILSIARNLLIDDHRRRRNRDALSLDERPDIAEALEAGGDGVAEDRRALAELAAILAPLGERERQVLALRFAADLTAAEIATVLDLTAANVHQIISRSLRRLRETAAAERS